MWFSGLLWIGGLEAEGGEIEGVEAKGAIALRQYVAVIQLTI